MGVPRLTAPSARPAIVYNRAMGPAPSFRRFFLALATCVALLATATSAVAAPRLPSSPGTSPGPAIPGKVIMVLLDGVSYEEIARRNDLPNFRLLQQRGCVGLTTVPLGVMPRNASAYATIGSGYTIPSAAAPLEYATGYDADERIGSASASAVYERNMGASPGNAEIVDPDIAALGRAFDRENVNGIPGAMGTALHSAGLHTALVGNGDGGWEGVLDRAGVLIAMDASGTVDYGQVGTALLTADNDYPFGVRTDYDRLYAATQRAMSLADLVVVETGDTRRARAEAPNTTAAAAKRARMRGMKAADAFIGKLLPYADERTLLLVVSPSAPDVSARAGKALAPVFAVGGRFPAGGLLYSPTTRHLGVIAPHDIAPTVLAQIGVRTKVPMIGLAVSGRVAPHASETLVSTIDRAGDLHHDRLLALLAFILYQIVLLVLLAIPEVQAWLDHRTRRWLLPFTLATTGGAMLLEPLVGQVPLPIALAATLALALAGAFALSRMRSPLRALLALSAVTTALVALDVAFGAPLTRWSFLGYDLVTGGRFYGIGNEFAGVLLGASTVAAACVVALTDERRRKVAVGGVAAVLALLVVLSVSPMLGADAGGALSAAVGYGVALYGFAGGRFTWRRLAVLAGVLLGAAVLGLFLANVVLAQSDSSHVGRFLVRIANGDFGFVTSTILRKLQANMHLMTVSIWSRLLIVAVAVGSWIAFHNRATIRESLRRERPLRAGLAGLLAGGVAGLAFNDSGVVMLATMSPFIILLLLTLSLPSEEAAS